VYLFVRDNHGADSATVEQEFIVPAACNQPPENVNITATPDNGCFPLTVDFTGSATDPDLGDTIDEYHWDFGDGSPAPPVTESSPTHVYTSEDDYTVSLFVRDNHGNQSVTVTRTISVGPECPPEIHIDPMVLNFNAQVGQVHEQVIIISNTGGGSFDAELTVLPEYSPGDNGYFQASFNEYFYPPLYQLTASDITYGSPVSLNVRYIPFLIGNTNGKELNIQFTTTGSPEYTITLNGECTSDPTDRPPFDFIAVLDKSGSMGGTSSCPEVDPLTKMEGLIEAGGLFYEIMREIVDESTDKIALIEYNSSPDLTVSMGWADNTKIGEAESAVGALSAGGSTSISQALEMAISTFYSSVGSRNRAILLLTDGRHNTPSWEFESDFDDPDDSAVHMSNIHLYTVGLGNDSNLNADLLKQIATEPFGPSSEYQFASPGGYRHTCSNGKLGIYFAQILIDNLDSSEQVVEDDEGEVKEGETSTETMPITVSTQKAIFYLTWQDPDIKLYFKLRAPDGTEIEPGYGIVKNGYAIYSLDFPLIHGGHPVNHAGEWQMIISVYEQIVYIANRFNTPRTNKSAGTPGPDYSPSLVSGQIEEQKTIAYESALITRDPVIRADFKVVGTRYYTGDEVLLTATLTEGGEPLLGADDVKAFVDVPAVALGDFLYENDISGDINAITDPDGSADSIAAKKLQLLLEENPGAFERTVFQLPMADDGTNGDTKANDGIYTLRLHTSGTENQTENNGIYSFKFKAGGKTLSGKRFERTKAIADYIISLPDPGNSTISYQYMGGRKDVDARLNVKLKDKFGHHLAPITTRKYNIFSKDTSIVDFKVNHMEDLLNGELVFYLIATSGEFSPYMDVEEIIGFEVGGTNIKTVSLTPKLLRWKYYLELWGGRFDFDSSIPVQDNFVYGLKLGFNFGTWWNFEGEFGYSSTEDSTNIKGNVFQYNINIGYTIPVNILRFTPFLSVGVGKMDFKKFTDEDSAFAVNVGAGLRWYPFWRKKVGWSFMVRDFIAINAYGNDVTHNLQYTAGIRIHF
jgi:PKD repeat protein